MGFVLSRLNLGAMFGQNLADIIYNNAGYYLVFGMGLGVIDFDFLLRVTVIEMRMAYKA